jgi:hypothetical protein
MTEEWVRNRKTGNVALVISRYINSFNNKPMIEVAPLGILAKSQRAYWLASSVEDAHA